MELVEQQNEFTIKLKELGDDLLYLLANAEGDILANEELIISLEETKATVTEINAKKAIADTKKEVEIGARGLPARWRRAARSSTS